ncbi:MAG: DUF1566 domain-containing protein [Bacteroidia bacterium]|nr:DUF1566 domain-containing protein [Bacteroidia bacterium]
MFKIIKTKINFILPLIILLNFTSSCEEEFDYGTSKNAVKTISASEISETTALISGNIITYNGSSITQRGICYSTTNNPTISNLKTQNTPATLGMFNSILTGLFPNTTYYARAYATNSFGTAYGNEISFITKEATIPILTSTTVPGFITQTSAVSGGTILVGGKTSITAKGVCWSTTNSTPTIANSKTINGTGSGSFSSILSNLIPNTTYYIRAYATNSLGTGYGNVLTFKTIIVTLPTGIDIYQFSSITKTSATCGGTITTDGGSPITAKGVCWSTTNSTPTIANSKTNDGTGLSQFTSILNSLSPGTKYYVRSYATNSLGTVYSSTQNFTTLSPTLPTGLTTKSITNITQTSSNSGGDVTDDGGAIIIAKGVCWSNTTSSPTTNNNKTSDGTNIGTFDSSITGLLPNTTYYIRSYARNSVGTSYGNVLSFSTNALTTPTGVTTVNVTSITQNSATSGGNISTDGGAPVLSKGLCWSNSNSNPTLSNNSNNIGTGIGSFSSTLSGLISDTNYYVRAYATNSAGTTYGSVINFTTNPNLNVGTAYQGGIIGYIFVPGDNGYISGETHGLIVSTYNISTGAAWGCSGTTINTGTSLGTGLNNTNLINNSCVSTSKAAALCLNYTSGVYNDWYLPSYSELNLLYPYKSIIGGFSSTYYWSSSQISSTSAWSINFANGSFVNTSKSNLVYVRAMRKF